VVELIMGSNHRRWRGVLDPMYLPAKKKALIM